MRPTLFLNPELKAAEAYMDGGLTFEDGSGVDDLLMLFSVNRAGLGAHGSQKLLRRVWRALRRWHQANPIGTAAKQARHHYDLSTELYRLFLDEDMQYSCAYFRDPEHDTLEEAQRYKLIHATAKLAAQAGHERGRDRLRLGRLCHSSRQGRPARASSASMCRPNRFESRESARRRPASANWWNSASSTTARSKGTSTAWCRSA